MSRSEPPPVFDRAASARRVLPLPEWSPSPHWSAERRGCEGDRPVKRAVSVSRSAAVWSRKVLFAVFKTIRMLR